LAPFQQSFIYREFGQKIFEARTYAEIDTVIKQAQFTWQCGIAREAVIK
jgi:hypothetical protein